MATRYFLSALTFIVPSLALVYNTYDGEGFPACYNVTEVKTPKSLSDIPAIIKSAASSDTLIRAGGAGHMWYDTQCADDATVIIKTENLNRITEFALEDGAEEGSVVIEAGVTFFQLAEYLHEKKANMGSGLVNWDITIAGAVAMGAHRSTLKGPSVVVGGVKKLEIVHGKGEAKWIEHDEEDDEWLAASCSLGLLGIITRLEMRIYPEMKVYAMQETLEEDEVLNGDIEEMIAPYYTANFWWWPYKRKFHWRYYDPVDNDSTNQTAYQSTFSVTPLEAFAARSLMDSGKVLPSSNWIMEEIFFNQWSEPNFRLKPDLKEKDAPKEWPVYGWQYDVLIGGLYPDQKPVWEEGLRGYTLELAFPMTRANEMLKRVREIFDAENKKLIWMTSTYRSGINIKFASAHKDFLGQATTDTEDGEDWSKGAIMFDFPTYRPSIGDHKRYNEQFYIKLAEKLVDEFPSRPHWTKNTREVFQRSVKNLDKDNLRRFKAVKDKFDPDGVFRSVVGEIIGMYD